MATIGTENNNIILDNKYVTITVSCAGASVLSVIDKKTDNDIKGDDTSFFSLVKPDKKTEYKTFFATLKNDIVTIETECGDFDVKVTAFDSYFEFELISELPENSYKARIAHAKYNYDFKNKSNTGACGIPLTYWVNPVYYPDCKDRITLGETLRHLKHKNARYALIIAPICEQKDIIKTAFKTIDRNYGIYSEIGGAWGRDSRLCFGNYTIQYESSKEFLDSHLEFFKEIGVDQIDFHQGETTFRQGDFKFERYESAADFKKNVSDVLEANGLASGLHTYSHYIRYDCPLLADEKWQNDLAVLDSFTLAEDIDETAFFLPTIEPTKNVSNDFTFFSKSTPILLLGNEVVQFTETCDGFKLTARGCAGSKAVAHKKGETIKHLEGFYHGVTPILGSNLFLEIARLTAKAFNEGGFTQIYLDAFDAITKHCDSENEAWFYFAQFVCEILKYTDKFPLIEYAAMDPSIWAARGRVGAFDTPFRSYKEFNLRHLEYNHDFIDRYSAPTLGWYSFYPTTDKYPGNEHTKYHHTDSIEFMGAMAVMYDFSNVFNGMTPASLERLKGLRRNVPLYRKYDDLRKQGYFSEDYLEKLRNGKYEYHLKEKDGEWVFVEKDYKTAKLFDLNDENRNFAKFNNPFNCQVPFIRIEAFLSTAYNNPTVLLKLDENKDLLDHFKDGETKIVHSFGGEIDMSDKLAKTVRVLGNGKKGSAVCIKTRCASNSELGFGEYIIDTDFEGWRDFILLESDNGDRPDLPFDKGEELWPIYRSSLNNDRLTKIEIQTAGDVSGVRMSSVVACEHTYEVLKNPTARIGDSFVTFECELMSSDFVEFDGTTAKVIDRYGNEKEIWFKADNFTVPEGEYTISLEAKSLNRTTPRAQLTIGLTGEEVK